MKKIFLSFAIIIFTSNASASIKNNIIQNLNNIDNMSFIFEQNINGNIENGECIIKFPKKIHCDYNLENKKILISNGRSIVIKTLNSYYIYPIEKTPLNLILDKDFLLKKIRNLNERVINEKIINYNFLENDTEINLFFDKKTYNLIGWQTSDIFQNLSITYLNSIRKNRILEKNLFKLPPNN
tara:strand:+ start:313 stop:861 length:549 start_codon:yes stop_codon:yes gene_type:complete